MGIISTQEANYNVNSKFKDGVSGPSKRAFDQFQKRATVAFKAAAVAIAGVTVALSAMSKKTLNSFDEIGKSADRIGITTDRLQEYRFALDKADVSQEQVDKGLLNFTKRLGKARQGIGALAGGLKGGQEELLETLKSTNDVNEALDVLFQAMGDAETATERAAIADAAFGGSGLKMTAAFKDGTEGFKEWTKFARESGAVISEELIRKSERLNDEMGALGTVMQVSFQTGLIEGFVDDFGGLHEMVVDPDFRQGLNDIGKFMGGFLRFMVENAKPIAVTSASLAALFLSSNIAGAVGLKGRVGGILALLAAVSAGLLVWKDFTEASEQADDATMIFGINSSQAIEKVKKESEELTDTFSNFGDSVGVLTTTILPIIGEIETANRSFIDSAQAGLLDYAETAGTVAQRVQGLFSRGFGSMEDSLVTSVKNMEFSFSSFIDSIISDLIRLQVQQAVTLPIAGFLGDFLGSFGGIQGTSPSAVDFSGLSNGLIDSGGIPKIEGSFASGINRVPKDMFARIHKDEAVLNKKDADSFRQSDGGGDTYHIEQTVILQPGLEATIAAKMEEFIPQIKNETLSAVIQAQKKNRLGGVFG